MPSRPRVLLVDDHIPLLESVRRVLAPAFDIAAVARDGHEALELATHVRPDVVVLDVAMPGLNGFQTLDQLRRDCPGTRVVFLTMHQHDDFVVAAINAGAHGYVLKSRIHLDLIGAINHSLAGRLFVPSLTSLSSVAGNGHTVQFHANDSHYLDGVSQLIRATVRSGEQVVMVAREATRIGVAHRLQARQMNLAMLEERGQYVALDSVMALSQVLHSGRPDKKRLAEMVHGLDRLRLAGPNGRRGRLTILGDMSGSLCGNGDFKVASELERMWTDLTSALPFFTVCSYALDCFEHSAAGIFLSNMCAEHSAVTSGIFAQRSLDIN